MRRKIVSLLLILVNIGCSKFGDSHYNDESFSSISRHSVVTPDIVWEYIKSENKNDPTKAAEDIKIVPVLNEEDTVMYLVNYKDGWEVLSASVSAPIVLASCATGHIDLEDVNPIAPLKEILKYTKDHLSKSKRISIDYPIIDSLGRNDWLNYYHQEDTLRAGGYGPWICIGTRIVSSQTIQQDPLLQTKWGQGYPWNSCMPYRDSTLTNRCFTGCTFTALGQVVNYYHNKTNKNQYFYGDFYSNSFIPSAVDSIVLNSSDIVSVPSSYSNGLWEILPLYSYSGTSTGYRCASSLMLQLRYYCKAKYGRTGTGRFLSPAPPVLDSLFSINCTYGRCDTLDMSVVYRRSVYANEMPVVLTTYTDSLTNGHVVVIDGYKHTTKLLEKHYIRSAPNGTTEHKYTNVWQYNESVTINWGYDGNNDWDPTTHEPIWFTVLSSWYSNATGINYNIDWEALYDFT